jgi:hypothetical protein
LLNIRRAPEDQLVVPSLDSGLSGNEIVLCSSFDFDNFDDNVHVAMERIIRLTLMIGKNGQKTGAFFDRHSAVFFARENVEFPFSADC